ncbi:hypothetical protein PACTADRAFT_47976 [Pachysolen tannophilus NRRL Y-2460]|uniref:Uncharacterized protein n=1 Tax=Pachysolen tannophilus NRRL Y-2460 TaxID=669874 RepID=A0A1E4U2F3_PACTA|nr:hypothetical protein PACTADRAFT_47976 [Pachysolen tannophilus NRRL Y-2460]
MHFTDSEEQKILVAQRKNRPTSPHLTIYQPQLTWIMSSFHRITGVYMAVGFYGLTCGYALFSVLGLPIDSNAIFEFYSSLPEWFKYGTKAAMAYPFVYHFANGIRHLVWDLAKELTIKGVYRTGYAVLATTALFGTYYTFFI